MKILLAKNSKKSRIETRHWIKREGMKTFLNKLAAWVLTKEPQHGECYIFIECVLPPVTDSNLRHGQIDILIVFSNAIIICEMKGHDYFKKGVAKEYATQLNGEIDWLKSMLSRKNSRSIKICPLIFCPYMNLSNLTLAQKEIINEERFIHISITGMKEELKMKNTYTKGIIYNRAWIFDAMDEYISERDRTEFNMSNCLFEMINNNTLLSTFDSFNKLYNYLLNYNRYSSLNPNPKYVKRIRAKEEKKIMNSLLDNKIIEVFAPPGIGKSELIRHIASQIECPVVELRVMQARNPSDILIKFIKEIYGDYDGVSSGDSLMKELTVKDLFFWIKEYDMSIFEVVAQFINDLKDHYSRYGQINNAYWVIESHKPIMMDENSFNLAPMDDNSILEILLQQRNNNEIQNIKKIIEYSHGNPRNASLLLSGNLDTMNNNIKSNRLTDFLYLDSMDKNIINLISILYPLCPLGLTDQLIISIYEVIHMNKPIIKIELTKKVQELLIKLNNHNLAKIITIDKVLKFFEYVETTEIMSFKAKYFVSWLSIELVSNISNSQNKNEWNTVKEKIKASLVDISSKYNESSLEYITASMLVDDFEPFFYSTFRYSSLDAVVEWLDDIDYCSDDSWQLSLIKAMKNLYYLWKNQDKKQVETENINFSTIHDLNINQSKHDALKLIIASRATAFLSNFHYSDLTGLIKVADSAKDQNVKADIYFSILFVLYGKHCNIENNKTLSWEILKKLNCQNHAAYTYSYFISRLMPLIYLNKKHGRDESITKNEVQETVRSNAQDLIKICLETNNIQLLVEICFYQIRNQELGDYGNITFSRLNSYREILDYLYQVNTKYVKKIQLLLTHGSILRHYCFSQNNISWMEYWPLMQDALCFYYRALQAATQINHSMHMLNSIAYSFRFMLNSFKFVHCLDSNIYSDEYYFFVGDMVEHFLHKFIYFNDNFDVKKLKDEEEKIYMNICYQAPLVLPLYIINNNTIPIAFQKFQTAFSNKFKRLNQAYKDNFKSMKKKDFFDEIQPAIQLMVFLKKERSDIFYNHLKIIQDHLFFVKIHIKIINKKRNRFGKKYKRSNLDKTIERLHKLIDA